MSSSGYLDVLKASYDYEPQSEDEIAIKEDQILILLEKTDDEWWKVKVKDAEDSEGGLVPAAYVEQALHSSTVKALYDYDGGAPGELSVKEDEVLLVYGKDDEWLLVKSEVDGSRIGFIPGNYVEETSEGAVTPKPASQIIIPPSPPKPAYIDPSERVAQNRPTVQVDGIKTWSVSEVDKKGKKKKGTLGVGNGNVFFASESDKAPVQQWPITEVSSYRIEKNKHVHIDVASLNLHFHAGSKDNADAIVEKLDSSTKLSKGAAADDGEISPIDHGSERKNGASVHFAPSPAAIIPPRSPSPEEEDVGTDNEYHHVEHEVDTQEEEATQYTDLDGDGEPATALYDFAADGEDELSVVEGEALFVIEKDSDEWWKCRNAKGLEGVVPASYIELANAPLDADDHTAREAEEAAAAAAAAEAEAEAQRKATAAAAAAKRAEQERKAKAEADRKRREREAERKEREAAERAEAEAVAAAADAAEREKEKEKERRRREAEAVRRERSEESAARTSSASASGSRSSGPSKAGKSGSASDIRRGPSPNKVRTWHDRTGKFQVDAQLLALKDGKLRLHKVNGVVIEVPAEKMSEEDLRYAKSFNASSSTPQRRSGSSDDEPLASRRASLLPESSKANQTSKATAAKQPQAAQPKKGPTIDWFEFFLNAGCDIDDCTRYASSFERDKIDESILSDITDQTMRSLGLREGDIIRVQKAIAARTPGTSQSKQDDNEQIRNDEELARQLQAEDGRPKRQTTSPAPNLFAGPGGALKNNVRRGRPSKSTPPVNLDIGSLNSASEQIKRTSSPATNLLGGSPVSSPVNAPPRTSSAVAGASTNAPASSGFDDDAWTNRPTSTKPIEPTPAPTARAPSAPPSQVVPPAPPPRPPTATAAQPTATATATQTAPRPATTTPTGSRSLAQTTEEDVFEQLARLGRLRTQNPGIVASPSPPFGFQPSPPIAPAPINAVPPIGPGFSQGLGIGSSLVPIGQHLQSLQTGVGLGGSPFSSPLNGARGPLAPVPTNQSLLQPLIPTTTGFNSFVSTRPGSGISNVPSYQPSPPPPVPPLPLAPVQQPIQTTSFLSAQPTGYPGSFGGGLNGFGTGVGSGFGGQQNGFATSPPLQAQPTGFPGGQFGGNNFTGSSFGTVQPQPTGLINTPFNRAIFGGNTVPPPVPPLPDANQNSTPANIFAQMKSGTFGSDDAPQSSQKYDALRPQPTGWGYQNGYSGY